MHVQVSKSLRAEGASRTDWLFNLSLAATGIFLIHVPFMVLLILLVRSVTPGQAVIAATLGTIVFLAIILRRHYPTVFFTVVMVLILLQMILLSFPTISWVVIPLAVYDVARRTPMWTARGGLIIALIVALVWPFRWMLTAMTDNPNLRTLMILVGAAAIGAVTTAYSIGRRGHDVYEAHSRQVEAERDAARLQIAEQTARQHNLETQIRTNIARELHDVVAHSISVMVVQAEGGLAQVERSPSTARQALVTISETGREALQEMRRIVRTLRSDQDTVDMTSAPTLADLPALVEKAQAKLTVNGIQHATTPTIEMTIYRVIQEGLTNSLKHAGPDADPRVLVSWRSSYVVVRITNKLTDSPPLDDHKGSGTGLIGMAERVQALGGTLTVGPNQKGGFEVCAQIPLPNDH